MSEYQLRDLNRDEYIASTEKIEDPKTVKFANMSLMWWDKHYLWSTQSCVVLSNADGEHLCYIFYHVDRHNQYMTIHNILTPPSQRRKGYAHELMKMVFALAVKKRVSRFKMTSISDALDFYLDLGFIYWGINSDGDYYCDLPVPPEGLDAIKTMIADSDTATLIGERMTSINTKVKGNESTLTVAQALVYDSDLIKMGDHYRLQG